MPEGGQAAALNTLLPSRRRAEVEEEEAEVEAEVGGVPEVESAALATLFRTQCPFSGLLTMKIFQLLPLLPLLPPFPSPLLLLPLSCLPFRFSFWFGSLLFNQ